MVELAVLALTLFFIAYPLARKEAAAPEGELAESDLSDLLYRKEAAYTALKDLEFDHAAGKIDDDDYKTMRARFEKEALSILERIEDHKKGVIPPRERAKTACPKCGAVTGASDKFCRECGARL